MKKINLGVVLLLLLFSTVQAQDASITPQWPDHFYAPYMAASGYPIDYVAKQAGLRYLTLAFVLSTPNKCQAAWDGGQTFDAEPILAGQLDKLRARGGDVIISFGGAAGTELALACSDVASLQAQYQSVIDTYKVTRLDFDIEGSTIQDNASIDRRSKALAALEEKNPDLKISFTLPVTPTGLGDDGLAVLQSAIDNDLQVDVVNIMTMDFGSAYPPDKMDDLTIQASDSLFDQLKKLYPDRNDTELWSMIGLTPMIGLNDSSPEVFTLDDAKAVLEYAQQKGIRQLAMWKLTRDKACSGNTQMVSETCSGIAQDAAAYSTIFNAFTPPIASP